MNKKNKKNYLNWAKIAKKELKNNNLENLHYKTPNEIEIKQLYTLEDLKNLKKLNHNNLEGIIAGKSYYLGKINIKKGQQILNSHA